MQSALNMKALTRVERNVASSDEAAAERTLGRVEWYPPQPAEAGHEETADGRRTGHMAEQVVADRVEWNVTSSIMTMGVREVWPYFPFV